MRVLLIFILLCSPLTAADNITSNPNIFGGRNFYNNGRSIGHSRSNNFGGQKFYDTKGRMGLQYGNRTGGTIYRGNADFGTAKGRVIPLLNNSKNKSGRSIHPKYSPKK